jgi:uncharacterized protein YbdZ (MbtH family)
MEDREHELELDYKVVVNHEEQYSIWPADRENAPGWRDVGTQGAKAVCLEYIASVWTDMRPLSLRKRMEELANNPPPPEPDIDAEDDTPPLVDRLSGGGHPVEISIRPERTLAALKECLSRDYVHVKFTGTRGGTELGIRIDAGSSTIPGTALESGTGAIHLEGTLTLDYVPVRCVADIDLQTMEGQGHLVKLETPVPA